MPNVNSLIESADRVLPTPGEFIGLSLYCRECSTAKKLAFFLVMVLNSLYLSSFDFVKPSVTHGSASVL